MTSTIVQMICLICIWGYAIARLGEMTWASRMNRTIGNILLCGGVVFVVRVGMWNYLDMEWGYWASGAILAGATGLRLWHSLQQRESSMLPLAGQVLVKAAVAHCPASLPLRAVRAKCRDSGRAVTPGQPLGLPRVSRRVVVPARPLPLFRQQPQPRPIRQDHARALVAQPHERIVGDQQRAVEVGVIGQRRNMRGGSHAE